MTVKAGARLDRLPLSSFHRRILMLIGIGMFFDGFDVYVAATVLGATLKAGFSTVAQNAQFVSVTFVGMMLGSFVTGFLGDGYGRRFTYQANLIIFGLASVAAAFAPSMLVLILLRGVMGLGLGAELVVGYAAMTEFVPPQSRGKWVGILSVFVVTSLPFSALASAAIVPQLDPRLGWRVMFVLAGLGGLVVWYLRKALPESPRWLESVGRIEEAEAIMRSIEEEVASEDGAFPPPTPSRPGPPTRSVAALLNPVLFPRLMVGMITLIVANTLIYGFVTWLPTFFVAEGRSIARSFIYSFFMSAGAPVGSTLGTLTADSWGRKPVIIGASLATILVGAIYPFLVNSVFLVIAGFLLVVAICVQVTLLFAIYVPELFPTDVRLRAAGICNTAGRAATMITPFFVVALLRSYGIAGVLGMIIGLLVVQIIVVLLFGVEPKKRRLEEMDSESSLSPLPSGV
ncbi:MAG TPA: MFS transporter [Candidatus Dormibacteraeota bacterium]|nr:MFS transporter [Candidatus Dormibacteraeota bacterium]